MNFSKINMLSEASAAIRSLALNETRAAQDDGAMTWPTPVVAQLADELPQAYLLIHIGDVLIDIGLAESFDDYCVRWLGQTPYLFHVPFEFVWLDDDMRKCLISILSEEIVVAGGNLDYAKTPEEHDELYVSLQKLRALRELIDAIPKLY